MGQITATRNLVAIKVVRHAGQWNANDHSRMIIITEIKRFGLVTKPLFTLAYVLDSAPVLPRYPCKGSVKKYFEYLVAEELWEMYHFVPSVAPADGLVSFGAAETSAGTDITTIAYLARRVYCILTH